MKYLIVYFITGLFLTLIFYLLGKIKKETRLADSSFVFLLWPIALLFYNKLFNLENSKPKTKLDELNAIIERSPELKLQKELIQKMQELSQAGTDKDEIPAGEGEFGLEVTNPVPTNTIFGSNQYLDLLRCDDGGAINYERLGSAGAENIPNPIDIYEIRNESDHVIANIYVDVV